MHSKKIELYKKTLKLSRTQRQILVGLFLGDGHLETQNKGRTYRLKVEHGLKQCEYVDFLYKVFKNWVRTGPKVKGKDGEESGYYFNTYSHGSFRFYGQLFYPKGKKVIPKNLKKLLTPLGLAIWFMDDGSLKSKQHKTYIIHTLGYSKSDLKLVQAVLLENFKIETSLHSQKEKYWRIYILPKSKERFRELIKPHIISSMKYKLDNTNA